MKIDKRNNHICYNDNKHIYWNEKNEEKYISATTIISKYKEPFDVEFWSLYKAAERLINNFNKASILKLKKDYNKALRLILKQVSKDLLETEISIIKQEWNTKKDIACKKGTKYHNEKEAKWLSKNVHTINNKIYQLATNNNLSEWNKAIFPELLLYNDEYKIAGQADLVIKDGKYITIVDYKSNEKLETKAYQNKFTKKYKMMLPPLQNVPDCDLEHYSIQLSLYAYMIEQLGDYKVVGLHIEHYEKVYKVKYRKKEIIKLLKYERDSSKVS